MSLLKCIAIDDEPKALEIIAAHCEKVPFLELRETFRDALDAVAYLKSHETDLIFLDINMPRLTGLQFLKLLKKQPMIIFVTAYSDYAIESYEYEAIDYLLKPIVFDRFLKATTRALNRVDYPSHPIPKESAVPPGVQNQFIYLKSGPKLHKLSYDDILFVEKDGNYLNFHTKDKKILSRQSMKNIFQILPETGFARVHRSYVINLNHIETIESHQVSILQHKIPVSGQYRDELMEKIGQGN